MIVQHRNCILYLYLLCSCHAALFTTSSSTYFIFSNKNMFAHGRRELPGILENKNCTTAASVSIVYYVDILKTDSDFQKRVVFCKEDFSALRLLSNAHAHEDGSFDAHQVIGLFTDISMLAHALGFVHILPDLRQYQNSLEKFREPIEPKKMRLHQQYLRKMSDTDATWKTSHDALEQEEADLRARLDRITSRKEALLADHEKTSAKPQVDLKRANIQRASTLTHDLKLLALGNQVRRMLDAIPTYKAAKLITTLRDEYAKSKQIQSEPNQTNKDFDSQRRHQAVKEVNDAGKLILRSIEKEPQTPSRSSRETCSPAGIASLSAARMSSISGKSLQAEDDIARKTMIHGYWTLMRINLLLSRTKKTKVTPRGGRVTLNRWSDELKP